MALAAVENRIASCGVLPTGVQQWSQADDGVTATSVPPMVVGHGPTVLLGGVVVPHRYAQAMSVSIYYSASRAVPLTAAETSAVDRVVAARESSFPCQDEESLCLYEDGGSEPDEIVAGATKMPVDPDLVLPVIAHVLDSVTELRRALPGAEWHVHMDDLDVPWDEDEGYALPGMRDTDF